jgi:hypothetical protein
MADRPRLPGRYPQVGPLQRFPAQDASASEGAKQPNGKLAMTANCAVVGPSRVLHGPTPPHDVIVPGVAVQQQFVLLSRNDKDTPKMVRLRLARNGGAAPLEGRMAVSGKQNPGGELIAGVFTPRDVEYLDFVNWDHSYEYMLLNGDQLYGLGTWAGLVPLNIVVTVLEWNA